LYNFKILLDKNEKLRYYFYELVILLLIKLNGHLNYNKN
jgi:hypothetical protein